MVDDKSNGYIQELHYIEISIFLLGFAVVAVALVVDVVIMAKINNV